MPTEKRKINPYDTISIVLVSAFSLAVLGFFLWCVVSMIIAGFRDMGWAILWVPVIFGIFIGILYLVFWGGEKIGKWWTNKSYEWDRKHYTPEEAPHIHYTDERWTPHPDDDPATPERHW